MSLAYKLPYTYEDYKHWEGDWELIGGEAIAMAPSPIGPHQAILSAIIIDIGNAVKKCEKSCYIYAELDYIIDEFNVFRPDITLTYQKVVDFIRTPPKMVIEILSPSTALKDTTIKFQTYQKEGVEFYMMVDYTLKQVKLFKLIDYEYKKIADSTDGSIEIQLDGCTITFHIDEWWKML